MEILFYVFIVGVITAIIFFLYKNRNLFEPTEQVYKITPHVTAMNKEELLQFIEDGKDQKLISIAKKRLSLMDIKYDKRFIHIND